MTSLPVDTPVVPPSLNAIAGRVEARLGPFLDAEIARWGDFDPALAEPLCALRDLVLAPAKRIRPAFCTWGHVAGGGRIDDPAVVDAGAAIELLQAFALIHDDIMDGSSVRRGRRTAHLTFADDHASHELRGESRRYGEGVAILIGDLAHVYADQFFIDAPASARRIWDELRIELNAGQYLDLHGTARGESDLNRTRLIARYKSGRYTVERPLQLGAALSGARERLGPMLHAYGDPLGEAFQLRDDLLGAFGLSEQTGKPVGDDLREGKPTTLLAEGLARADTASLDVLSRVGDPNLDATAIARVQDVLVSIGARAAVEDRIDTLTHEAIEALDDSLIDRDTLEALVGLAWYVAHRNV